MIENVGFVKDFIKICQDAYNKGWHERNGGNISYRIRQAELEEVKDYLVKEELVKIEIGTTLKNLANEYFLVTGSGKFIRNMSIDLSHNAGIVKIDETGRYYSIVWGLIDALPTSEFPSHLMSHSVKKEKTNGLHRVVMHSHPTNVIALTFVLPLKGEVFTRELWEMATECPVVFPKGIGVVEWMVPGSVAIGKKTSDLMKQHDVVVWAHHGVFCSEASLDLVFGLMDTVEKAAEILVKVISMGGKRQTISSGDFKELARDFKVEIDERYL